MAEADVRPVFVTPRQRLVRDVLVESGLALLFWGFFLREPPGFYAGGIVAAGFLVGALALVVRARDLLRWPEQGPLSVLAGLGVGAALIFGLWVAEFTVAWTVVGLSAGVLAARLLLYATGAWRPGDPT